MAKKKEEYIVKSNINPKLETLIEEMSKSEQTVLLKQLGAPNMSAVPKYEHKFAGRRARIGVISDTHIGSSYFDQKLMNKLFQYYKRQGVEAIYHAGDITEGMSGRPGHIYELDSVGLTAQVQKAAEVFNGTEIPIFGITGNHDHWFMQKADMGADVGEMLDNRVENFTHLGLNEADIELPHGIRIKLVHPGKGTSYALSYQGQKLVESYTDEEKPDIQFSGHYHKALYMHLRGVHHFESGTVCAQTGWMRSKNIPAHMGGWMVDIFHNKKGLDRVISTFITP